MAATKRDTTTLPAITRQYPIDDTERKMEIVREILVSNEVDKTLLAELGMDELFNGKSDKEIKTILLDFIENGFVSKSPLKMEKPSDIMNIDKLIAELKKEKNRTVQIQLDEDPESDSFDPMPKDTPKHWLGTLKTSNQYFHKETDEAEFVKLFGDEGTLKKFKWIKNGYQLCFFFDSFYANTDNITAKYLQDHIPMVFINKKDDEINYNNQSTPRMKGFDKLFQKQELEDVVDKYRNKYRKKYRKK